MIYATATVINPVALTHKHNSFKKANIKDTQKNNEPQIYELPSRLGL